MNIKYRLTNDSINLSSRILHRIQAVKDFSDVKAGDLGGYVETEENLSQVGNAWIYHNAKVFDRAKVYDNVKIYDNARVFNKARIYNNAIVLNDAKVFDCAKVGGRAEVRDNALIFGNADVFDIALVRDNARVFGDVCVFGIAKVGGNTTLTGNALVSNVVDYIVFKNFWSSGRYFTWTRSNNMWKVGCFYGTGEELIEKAYKDSKRSGIEYERVVKYVESVLADKKIEHKEVKENFFTLSLRSLRRLGTFIKNSFNTRKHGSKD